ncbi:hypothetical protein RRG08_004336 [Elysia crispata]|uniref:Uncharacterized protein n=1 Tax=Elysia crispata TaxID=231223 RepID=A0AAE1B0C4_9GAST|nr:hypothetical protein RRG08_004336 [Elysia crispata]
MNIGWTVTFCLRLFDRGFVSSFYTLVIARQAVFLRLLIGAVWTRLTGGCKNSQTNNTALTSKRSTHCFNFEEKEIENVFSISSPFNVVLMRPTSALIIWQAPVRCVGTKGMRQTMSHQRLASV